MVRRDRTFSQRRRSRSGRRDLGHCQRRFKLSDVTMDGPDTHAGPETSHVSPWVYLRRRLRVVWLGQHMRSDAESINGTSLIATSAPPTPVHLQTLTTTTSAPSSSSISCKPASPSSAATSSGRSYPTIAAASPGPMAGARPPRGAAPEGTFHPRGPLSGGLAPGATRPPAAETGPVGDRTLQHQQQ